MRASRFVVCTLSFLAWCPAQAQNTATTPSENLSKLPVREVTVFKDGHAFVLQEGFLPVDAAGQIVLDDLPTPVLGTFWPYQVDGKLRGVVASRESVSMSKTALSIIELLKANIGADVTIIDNSQERFDARILDVPQAPPVDILPTQTDADRYSRSPYPTPAQADMILLQTKDGVLARALSSINQVIFKNPPRRALANPEFRTLLRLNLGGAKRAAGERVQVGMVYLQKGLRWIPGYRLALDGRGRVGIKMQATLVNEMIDLDNATANFVIGVPSFAFKDTVDPLALQNTFARLSPLFNGDSRSSNAFSMSNAIQVQSANSSYGRINDNGASSDAASIPEGAASEDFFVFTARNLLLRKGERMAFPLAQYDLRYEDIYTLEAPAKPPVEVYSALSYDQQSAVNKTLSSPSVMHKIRIFNTGTQPLTTAPALIESEGRLLAQTLMTYTATGGRSDLDLAPAVDVTVKRRETEGRRTPAALKWRDNDYARVDVGGRLMITSYRNTPITLELTQQFIGTVDRAEQGGVIRKLGLGDDESGATDANQPSWWKDSPYTPNDWRSINGLSSVKWTVTVPAKKSLEIPYTYHYFWR